MPANEYESLNDKLDKLLNAVCGDIEKKQPGLQQRVHDLEMALKFILWAGAIIGGVFLVSFANAQLATWRNMPTQTTNNTTNVNPK